MSSRNHIYLLLSGILSIHCTALAQFTAKKAAPEKTSKAHHQFTPVPDSQSSITFVNRIVESPDLNVINYAYVYNGAGVATADFNNDDLVDIFMVCNQGPNRLYINKGDFEFEDVTEGSGLADAQGWSMGVSVVDVNNDGLPDLYICKAGSLHSNRLRQNRLYINQGDLTFVESAAQWRVNDAGFSTQAYFLDFDKDGDLDLYLVNHRPDFENTGTLDPRIESAVSPYTSDKLYRNDGQFFSEITHAAGLVNKAWGLSAAIGDFNDDGWPDIHVCNDFLAPDFLYINNRDFNFTDQAQTRYGHISFNSMGCDYADIDNDLRPDLLVLEMAAEDHLRSKSNMATMNTQQFNGLVEFGYHRQYMVNTLQRNTAGGRFSEIGQLAGIAKTDWSWAGLIADLDNDGWKDIFVTNGILKELGNQDASQQLGLLAQKGPFSFKDVQAIYPSSKLGNYAFRNQRDLTFGKVSSDWNLDMATHSSGAAYADLDNDGDLDLVINNLNHAAQVYRNNDTNHFIQLRLEGSSSNKLALGTGATLSAGGQEQFQQLYLARGYLSSVQNVLHFGLGAADQVDEIVIEWPDGRETRLENIAANQILTIRHENSQATPATETPKEQPEPWVARCDLADHGLAFRHRENAYDDYRVQVLLPHSQSHNGPFLDAADVNGDGLDDLFVGGAAGQAGALFIQQAGGSFQCQPTKPWEQDKGHEDLGVLFFDAEGDGDQDLYVVSGGSEFPAGSPLLRDRLYLNNGQGRFHKDPHALPDLRCSGQQVAVSDIDKDGDLDLFVGGRSIPDHYPFPPASHLLINDGGRFHDATGEIAPELGDIGMVTGALFTDHDNDGDEDLLVVGEWMPITFFENQAGKLRRQKIASLADTEGLWFSIAGRDIDHDGDTDYFVGNLGLNTKFKASVEQPFLIYADDFDASGTCDIVLCSRHDRTLVPLRGRQCSAQQMPFIAKRFPDFQSFATASLADIYGQQALQKALQRSATRLASVFLENTGDGEFAIHKLPNPAQVAPVMDFGFLDLDGDGREEVILVGNHYQTEAETVRYDASHGAVLAWREGALEVIDARTSGFFHAGNAKDLSLIRTKEGILVLVTNNDGELCGYRVREGEDLARE